VLGPHNLKLRHHELGVAVTQQASRERYCPRHCLLGV
jgi:hypothetical protein